MEKNDYKAIVERLWRVRDAIDSGYMKISLEIEESEESDTLDYDKGLRDGLALCLKWLDRDVLKYPYL